MPELDTVRGVAILLVLFFHGFGGFGTAGLTGFSRLFVLATTTGWTGVNLFFVLSGFLITGILIDGKEKPNYYKNFYIRRALRILPGYYMLLVLLWILPRIGVVDRPISWGYIALCFVYLSNVTNFFGVPMQYGPLWSLAVEEHFYLVWPTAVRFFSRRKLAYLAVVIFLACPLLRAIAFGSKSSIVQVQNPPYTWLVADGLAAGSLMAIFLRRANTTRRSVTWVALLTMGSALLLIAVGMPFGILLSRTLLGGGSLRLTVLNLFFTGILGTMLLVGTSGRQSLVQWPVLRFLGDISYGLYLIHMLAFDAFDHLAYLYVPSLRWKAVQGHFGLMLLRFVIAAGVAVFIAFLSRRTFEEKFLTLKDQWTSESVEFRLDSEQSARAKLRT
jgi:peptidoglycan/LPS O-acetylase OafA/YrhL